MKKILLVLGLLVFCTVIVNAQGLLNQDLRQIRIDQLSDADILMYYNKVQQAGIPIEQAYQMAAAKGMPAPEIQKLKQRIQLLNPGNKMNSGRNGYNNTDTIPQRDSSLYMYDSMRIPKPLIDPRIFGSELFNNQTLNFEPNIRLATPINYTVGPDDVLELSVYGMQETNFSLTVNAEGSVSIPNVGQIKVSGLSLEEATQRIKIAMQRTVYSSLQSGRSKLSVTIGNIRSIRVTIIGSNKPGNYTLSSLTTAFNALFICGGPKETGSFREIELIRNNKVFKKIDLYRFLVNGDQSDNVTLKDNDVIRIPSYKSRVDLQGYVKRPGIFELLPGETFSNLLEFASGFADSAYRSSVKVTQFTDKEFTVKDVSTDAYSSYTPQSGDKIEVSKILDRYSNRIKLSGAVFREGTYELVKGMTVGDLIKKADGLREDAYTSRGQIFRLKDDLSKELVSFNPLTNTNILLKREDSVVIKSILELREDYYISVQGEVRLPGFYEYNDSLTLKDLILQSGGLTDAAYPQKIEIARLIQRDTLTFADVRASDIIEITGMADLASAEKNVLLKPNDVVTIRRKPGFLKLESVMVSGELQYPGPYVLQKREERVSDLIKRAGGFTPEAYPAGAFIKRYNLDDTIRLMRKQTVQNIQQQLSLTDTSSSIVTENYEREYDQIPLNLARILLKPGSPEDVVLKARDQLIIPRYTAQVKISGSVLFPTQIAYNEEYNFRDYLSAAGGVSDVGRKKRIYVIAANGRAKSTRSFLFFKNYPKVEPGSEIIVPPKQERMSRLSTGEVIGIASALASLAGVVIAILRL